MSMLASPCRRAVVAANGVRQSQLLALFDREPLNEWEVRAADSFAHARFLLQHRPADLLLVSGELLECEGNQALAWLAFQEKTPVFLLGDDAPDAYACAFEAGAVGCLPQALAETRPAILHAALEQALKSWRWKHEGKRARQQAEDARKHVDRLVQMIWRITPRHDDQWYSHRHMLDRLQEELARCQRHQVPLSIAVGELESEEVAPGVAEWSADVIVRGKRRSDVVGQYGPSGFMLLMTHTTKPGGVVCCQRLQEYLEHPAEPCPGPVRSYFGLASATEENMTPQGLLREAEENLERAREMAEPAVVAN